ncbi:hypothetical protein [Desulfofundulus sp. TPOSR]|uniref:hypothetical protein n=1 Tax=Desulfofundulus sp. TPOSR TaxID=2714340 RepID=UPI001FADCB59|nr:hypothetical protein [Desulfofundulus sp. TPOSR]
MMEGNKLWWSRRLMLPEMREKAVHTCSDCRFLVRIQGREEVRWGCVAGLPGYGSLRKRVPEMLPALDILKTAGKEGLRKVLEGGNPERPACGFFLAR